MDIKKLKPLEELLDSVRDIEGFPIGKDEDILNLSNAPYYTACPNPYINDFIDVYGKPYNPDTDTYERKPFVGDVSEGKNDPIYRAYTYHTQVPHKAIQNYISHYTEEGDVVYDGFCGTGTTAIAAQALNRNGIVSDLSPYASLIGAGANVSDLDINKILDYKNSILSELSRECLEFYLTNSDEILLGKEKATINYTVWSSYLLCPYCKNEFLLWDYSVSETADGKLNQNEKFKCQHCNSDLSTKTAERILVEKNGTSSSSKILVPKVSPVLIYYNSQKGIKVKKPDEKDIEMLNKIENTEIPYWYPIDKIMGKGENWGDSWRKGVHKGLTQVDHFFTKKNLYVLSFLNYSIHKIVKEKNYKLFFLNAFLALVPRASIQNRYIPQYGNRHVGIMSGTLYTPHFFEENNLIDAFERRVSAMTKGTLDKNDGNVIISNQSILDIRIKDNSIDYIFTDPPFGDNLMYSELNFIREAWLKVITNNKTEAIINKTQNKALFDYKDLMIGAFKQYYRVLKPNRWITVEFHNSKASVWNVIQESITKAGFIIAQVSILDKEKGTIKQLSSPGAVKNDLVINAYKPKEEFKNRFLTLAGEGMEIDFVKQQLEHLPLEPNIERTEQMLYSKMLAHYIENGFKVKYNSINFYNLLEDNFVEIDGYWFDDSEINKYNEWKSKQGNLDKIKNILSNANVLFISDEKSALTWIYNFLDEPKSYGDIYTAYQQVATANSDEIPELRELLDNNFFTTDGKYRRPDTRQERQELKKNREKELERAWNKMLEKLKGEKKKIKNLRKEALLFGLQKCYDGENYKDILLVADKLHASVLEENSDISDFIDIAMIKSEANKEGTLF